MTKLFSLLQMIAGPLTRSATHGCSGIRQVEHVNAVIFLIELFSVILPFQERQYWTATV